MIKPIDVNEIPGRKRWSRVVADIRDFLKSDMVACEVVVEDGESVLNKQSAYNMAIKRDHFPVYIMRRSNRLFLIKEEPTDA